MQVVILAGGAKSTITDEMEGIPKPMALIGERPILWHIMKYFSTYDCKEFIICGGYKVNQIKDYFQNFYIYQSDITVDLQTNQIEVHKNKTEDWKVTVVDTGVEATTSERIFKIHDYISEDAFIVVYGDCLSDISVENLINQHIENQKAGMQATIVVTRPTGRNQIMSIDGQEQQYTQAWVNACIMVFSKEIFSLGLNQKDELEHTVIEKLVSKNQIAYYRHEGFWTPVETNRDRVNLEQKWNSDNAPWKKWN